jgi:opine dehydrogenase
MRIAVLGAGGGGASAVVELGLAGYDIRLWNRSADGLAGFVAAGGVCYKGVFGDGMMPVAMTTDIAVAAHGADVLLVCLPTTAHAGLADILIAAEIHDIPIVLNPGHTGGAMAVAQIFATADVAPPPIAEMSTLTYVARRPQPGLVDISGMAKSVIIAALPGGEAALAAGQALYPAARRAQSVIASSLANVNMVLHPPGAILGASWVEASGGDFTFYVEGMTDGVARVIAALDAERLAVAAAFGIALPTLFDEMQAIGTIEAGARREDGLAAAIRGGVANARIKAPDSLAHRYFREDLWFGLQPFLAFAGVAQMPVPTAAALFALGRTLVGDPAMEPGRTAAAMGFAGLNKDQLLAKIDCGEPL